METSETTIRVATASAVHAVLTFTDRGKYAAGNLWHDTWAIAAQQIHDIPDGRIDLIKTNAWLAILDAIHGVGGWQTLDLKLTPDRRTEAVVRKAIAAACDAAVAEFQRQREANAS